MEEIMKKLSELRKESKLSQEKFSEKLGVTRETLSNWENGKVIPSSKNLEAICNLLGVTLEEISKEEKSENNNTNNTNDNKRKSLTDELKTNLKEDLKSDLKEDLKIDIKEDIKTDIKADIKEDLKTDLKADIKEDLKTDLQQNLKTDLKTHLKDLSINLRKDLKEEQDKSSKERKIRNIKKARKIILTILICISFVYIGYSAYKFNVLTQIGKKVSKYENLDNYYCEIQTYNNDFLKEKEEIWYKNNKYKIENYTYNDIGQLTMKVVTIMNLDYNFQITYTNGNTEKAREIANKDRYENGRYMYSMFPEVIQNNFKRKLGNSLKINLLKTQKIKNRNIYSLKINSLVMELDSELYIPIFYTSGEMDSNNRKYYNVKLNCVKDKDLII